MTGVLLPNGGFYTSEQRTHSPETVDSGGVTRGASPNPQATREITKLIRVGGKLGTLGVLHGATTEAQAHWWHVARPGTIGRPDPLTRMTFATSLCRRNIATNGYASDFRPPDGALCPACKELL